MATEATIVQRVEAALTASWPNADIAMILPNNSVSTPASGKYAQVDVKFQKTDPYGLPGGKRRQGYVQIVFFWTRNDGSQNVFTEARAITDILDGKTIGSTWFHTAVIQSGISSYAKNIIIHFTDTEAA